MDDPVEKSPSAWQPFTPRGVAAFARASWKRLLLVQFVFALLSAGVVILFLQQCWFPVIAQAIEHLAPEGEIRTAKLNWQGDSPVSLAENRFLALTVDLEHTGTVRSPAHVQLEFGQSNVKFLSLLGSLKESYPAAWRISFNRSELGPWWGAWGPPILAIAGGIVVLGLLFSWTILASLYCLPIWLVGFFANRDLSLSGSWRLAGAALMPGAIFFSAAIVSYAFGLLDLIRLAAAAGGHVIIGWVYLLAATLASPCHPGIAFEKGNPFQQGQRGQDSSERS